MAGSNWQQLAGGSVNPYDVLRDDGTPTADYGQHVICDGGTVTLPSPKADEAVLVSNISQDTTVTTSTGLVEQKSDVTHIASATDPVLFVSDGTNWYVANNLDYLSAILDPAVYRWKHDDQSGTTLTDSDPDGDGNKVNGTISNPTWVQDSTAQGGYKLSFDDTTSSEYVDFAKVPEVGESSDFAVGITVELDTTSDTGLIWMHSRDKDNDYIVFGLSNDKFNGEITALARGGNYEINRTLGADTTTNRMRLLINYSLSDDNNRTIRMYKNTSNVDSSTSTSENALINNTGHRVGTRQGDRSGQRLGGDTDDLIIYNDTLTSSQIQADYDLQPWS